MSDATVWMEGLAALMLTASAVAAERVVPMDLVKHREPNEKVQIREIASGEYEWSLPDGVGQTLEIDLSKLGVKAQDYDEFRFDLKPLGSQVDLHATLFGFDKDRFITSWYLKFKTATDQWATGRYDLRVDDDGAAYPERFKGQPGILRLDLGRRVLGYAGEPQWRKAVLRNPRLIKWAVAVEFDPRDVKIGANDAGISYTYGLKLRNRTDRPLTAKVDIDPEKGLKEFRAEPNGIIGVELAAGEEKVVPIQLLLVRRGMGVPPVSSTNGSKEKTVGQDPRTYAEQVTRLSTERHLPPAYAERICPKVWVEGVVDSDVSPLLGYRPMPMWAVVPVTKTVTPQEFQARVAEAGKFMPVDGWKKRVLDRANETLKCDWPVMDWVRPGGNPLNTPFYGQCYTCPDCKSRDHMRRDPPNSATRHFCNKCQKVFEANEYLDDCVRVENFADYFQRVRNLAQVWLLTGDARYADKAIAMAAAYAEAHPKMTVVGERSTGTGSRLGKSALVAAWNLPNLAEARAMLASYPGLAGEPRRKWDAMLLDEGLRVTRQCGLFLNQQDEYIKVGASVALAIGYWPLLGEAIHGDFGWHAQVEFGFSEDGIGHEGIAYHRMKSSCMYSMAALAMEYGLDLLAPRFKRVFDGSLSMGEPVGSSYELAYRKYRDPTYLPGLEAVRKNPDEISILLGELPLPKASETRLASTLMEGSGFIFLRKGTPVDSREIRLNYKAQLDRGEADRYSTWFYRNNRLADSCLGRCLYTDPGAAFQGETAAHNTIVIDGQNSRDVVGELVAYQGDGDTPFAVVATDPRAQLFEGVRQLRGIALLGDAYVVFDRVTCDAPRTIDRYQYGQGQAVLKFPAVAPAAPLGRLNAKGMFSDVVSGLAGKELRIDFGGDLRMRLVSDQEMTGCKARTQRTAKEAIDVTWARVDNAKSATFLATFSLGKDLEPPAAMIVKSTDSEIVLEVTGADKAYGVTVKPTERKADIVVRDVPVRHGARSEVGSLSPK